MYKVTPAVPVEEFRNRLKTISDEITKLFRFRDTDQNRAKRRYRDIDRELRVLRRDAMSDQSLSATQREEIINGINIRNIRMLNVRRAAY